MAHIGSHYFYRIINPTIRAVILKIVIMIYSVTVVNSYIVPTTQPMTSGENETASYIAHMSMKSQKSDLDSSIPPAAPFEDDDIFFCGGNKSSIVIVPVFNNSNVTIPCWTDRVSTDKYIRLYKGSPDTIPISENDTANRVILEHVKNSGFRFSGGYEIAGGTDHKSLSIGKYTCHIEHTKKYLIVELVKDDNFISVTSATCSLDFYVESQNHSFYCQARGDVYRNDTFAWFYQTDGGDIPISHGKRQPHSVDGFIKQELRINFTSSNITGIICKLQNKKTGEWFSGLINVSVKEHKMPIIRDDKTEEIIDQPGLQLTCVATLERNYGVNHVWYKDGIKLHGDTYLDNTDKSSVNFTLKVAEATYNMTNYTCLFTNHIGAARKTFLVKRNNTVNASPGAADTTPPENNFLKSAYLPIIFISISGIVALLVVLYRCAKSEQKKSNRDKPDPKSKSGIDIPLEQRNENTDEFLAIFQPEVHQEEKAASADDVELTDLTGVVVSQDSQEQNASKDETEPRIVTKEEWALAFLQERIAQLRNEDLYSTRIQINLDQKTCKKIDEGMHGEIFKTTAVLPDVSDPKTVILKTFKWTPDLTPFQANLVCNDLVEEIGILQTLGNRHPNIVRYLSFKAPYINCFKVFLVLEYCSPGNLSKFINKHREQGTYCNDIIEETFHYEERISRQNAVKELLLGTSHLMKFAEQAASAMKFLADNNIVHRDLSARNMLLKAPTAKYESIDDLILLISDFGMARRLCDNNPCYIVENPFEDTTEVKPRHIPVLWYPPEALGKDAEFQLKSDVWSFCCCVWEQFALCTVFPHASWISKRSEIEQFKARLMNGDRLKWDDLPLPVPLELLEILQSCWESDPEERPSFEKIHQDLFNINHNIYRLYNQPHVYSDSDPRDTEYMQEVSKEVDENENSECVKVFLNAQFHCPQPELPSLQIPNVNYVTHNEI